MKAIKEHAKRFLRIGEIADLRKTHKVESKPVLPEEVAWGARVSLVKLFDEVDDRIKQMRYCQDVQRFKEAEVHKKHMEEALLDIHEIIRIYFAAEGQDVTALQRELSKRQGEFDTSRWITKSQKERRLR